MSDAMTERMVQRIADLERRLSSLERMEHSHNRFGNIAGGNYAEFESDGTLKYNGNATVYEDINAGFSGAKVPAVNAPTWATLVGNLSAYQFAVNDYLTIEPREIEHAWREASQIEFHVHWITGVSDGTARGVKWEIEYAWANMLASGGTTAFGTSTVISAETTIAASTPIRTHIYTSVGTLTPTGGKIGAYLLMRVRRIAATGTAPSVNPFGMAAAMHIECDTTGSRTTAGK